MKTLSGAADEVACLVKCRQLRRTYKVSNGHYWLALLTLPSPSPIVTKIMSV